MITRRSAYTITAIALALSACTTVPTGPSRMALPGSGKSFEQFNDDDRTCRTYSLNQSNGVSANKAGNDSFVESAAVGTAVGALLGAAVGGNEGAAVGAGTGLLVGSAAGSDAAAQSSYTVQQRYDNAYVQCMYAKGHKVPVSADFARATVSAPNTNAPVSAKPPTQYYPPPPPPNY
ncbi:MAG TPA: YMGG-like glycine zipper-containing protein [Methyloradius sp.]